MSYFESLDNDLILESVPVGVSFSSMDYSLKSFLDKIKDKTFSRTKIKSIIENNLDNYFSHDGFMSPTSGQDFVRLWTNIDFLEAVYDLLSSDEIIRSKVKTRYIIDINLTVADYMNAYIIHNSETPIIERLHMEIASLVNAEYIIMLAAYVPLEIAKYLSIAASASFLLQKNVAAVNSLIESYHQKDPNIFTIQKIISIYFVFYKDSFSGLFNTTMTVGIDREATGESKRIKDMISSAILNILNSMPSNEISKTLMLYSKYLTLEKIEKVRFSLLNLPTEFGRIVEVAKKLSNEGYYSIP